MSGKRNLNDWLSGYMRLVENSEPPVLFHKWCGISAIASALQRKVKFDLGLSLTINTNFYIVLVGPSATGKNTAMAFMEDIIKEIPSIRVAAQATSLQALIKRMKETNLTDLDPATGKQIFHSSTTVISNEFTVFLGYHNNELISTLCDWYDCKEKWTYDTIKRDREEIFGVWVNILAGTTPDNIQTALPVEAIGAGLTSRIIFVNEEKKNKLVVIPGRTPAQIELREMLIRDLEQISLMTGNFEWTQGAYDYYHEWCYKAEANPPFHDKKFDGYNGRRRKHLLSLAMVCSASRKNDLFFERDDVVRAAELLEEVEVKMGTVFRGIGKSNISGLMNDVLVFLENSLTKDVPMWSFYRRFEGDADKIMIDRVLQTLEMSRYIQVIQRPGMESIIHVLPPKDEKGICEA
jgi:energy-coupling factor transporter ATP-binding protein EcfA2